MDTEREKSERRYVSVDHVPSNLLEIRNTRESRFPRGLGKLPFAVRLRFSLLIISNTLCISLQNGSLQHYQISVNY